jgi:hypothetical protein
LEIIIVLIAIDPDDFKNGPTTRILISLQTYGYELLE